jgi:hypothetical protein
LVTPTELLVGVVSREGPDEVFALYGRVLVLGAALDWSTRGGPTRDPRSLDPLEAPERLHNLFNCEGHYFLLHCTFARGEESHRSILSVLRETQCSGDPPCDHESIGVAPVSLRNKHTATAPAAHQGLCDLSRRLTAWCCPLLLL